MINKINILSPSFGTQNKNKIKNTQSKYSSNFNNVNFSTKKGCNKMTSDRYEQINPEFDKDNAILVVKKRIKGMPMMMDRLFGLISEYLSGDLTRKAFVDTYQDEAIPLYKRIDLGKNREAYKEAYKPEIVVIKNLSTSASQYKDSKIDEKQFDSNLEQNVDEYVNTELTRKVRFTV